MIYTPQTKKAINLMFEVHKEQRDKTRRVNDVADDAHRLGQRVNLPAQPRRDRQREYRRSLFRQLASGSRAFRKSLRHP